MASRWCAMSLLSGSLGDGPVATLSLLTCVLSNVTPAGGYVKLTRTRIKHYFQEKLLGFKDECMYPCLSLSVFAFGYLLTLTGDLIKLLNFFLHMEQRLILRPSGPCKLRKDRVKRDRSKRYFSFRNQQSEEIGKTE